MAYEKNMVINLYNQSEIVRGLSIITMGLRGTFGEFSVFIKQKQNKNSLLRSQPNRSYTAYIQKKII